MKKTIATQVYLSTQLKSAAAHEEAFPLSGESRPALVVGHEHYRLFNGIYRNDAPRYYRDPRFPNRLHHRSRRPYRDPDDEKGMKLLIALLAAGLIWTWIQVVS